MIKKLRTKHSLTDTRAHTHTDEAGEANTSDGKQVQKATEDMKRPPEEVNNSGILMSSVEIFPTQP